MAAILSKMFQKFLTFGTFKALIINILELLKTPQYFLFFELGCYEF